MKVVLLDTDMSMWAPGTRLYQAEDGQHYAVHADALPPVDDIGIPEEIKRNMHTILPCESSIVACDDRGSAPTLDPIYVAAPGTSHEDTLAAAGFEIDEIPA